ncbi:glycosyltransferase family 25 protein [Ahrensia marina]|uniref:glycosyltransferase family 25 protein n=1 Tax=Ahrensia marina TaxID=1514904 RepID=UPI0006B4B70A|nr:glycosyltransferase family 25 protein [Ahrensia marina]
MTKNEKALPILLVNLDRSEDRLIRMKSIFDEMGLSFSKVPAVDGRNMSDVEIDSWLDADENFYRLRAGEVGCFLSHRACWSIAAANEQPFTVIFEDDVHIGEAAVDLLGDVNWIPKDADIIKLETNQRKTFISKNDLKVPADRSLNQLTGEHTGTAGYIISSRCAQYLLDNTARFKDPLDQYLFNPISPIFASLKIYQLFPALCVQDENLNKGGSSESLRSTLHEERRLNRLTGLAKLKRELSRPLKKAFLWLSAQKKVLFHSQKYQRIPFK